jgi:hypothetical protein
MKTIKSRATTAHVLTLINKAIATEAKPNLELIDTIPNTNPPIEGVWVYNGIRYVLAKN